MEERIIKVKNRQERFVVFDCRIAEDERLSFKARGIMAYLMTRPPNWKVNVKDLINRSAKDGRDAVRAGLKELIEFRYARLVPIYKDGKLRGREYQIFENPSELLRLEDEERKTRPSVENRKTENQTFGKPDSRKTRPISKEGLLFNNEVLTNKEENTKTFFRRRFESALKEGDAEGRSLSDVVFLMPGQPTEKKCSEWLSTYGEEHIREQLRKSTSYFLYSAKGKKAAKNVKSFQRTFGNWLKKEYLEPRLAEMANAFCRHFVESNRTKYRFNRFDMSDDVKSLKSIRQAIIDEGVHEENVLSEFVSFLSSLPPFYKSAKVSTLWKNYSTILAQIIEAKEGGKPSGASKKYSTIGKMDFFKG